MAYEVTKLVRRARLPDTVPNRPVAKAVLLALADRCARDGSNAYPAQGTIGGEAEVGCRKTVRRHLQVLHRHGLIHEQEPPQQGRVTVWRLDLKAIGALIQHGAPVPHVGAADSDVQHGAPVPHVGDDPDGAVPPSPGAQCPTPPGAPCPTTWGTVPHDPVLEPVPMNKNRTSAKTPSLTHTAAATAPNGDNFQPIRALAIDVTTRTGLRGGDLIEAVKCECAKRGMNYGDHDAVPFDVVHRACESAEWEVYLKPKLGIRSADPAKTGDRE
jgi:hypothetical protein